MNPLKQQETSRKNAQFLRKNMTKEERHLWYDFLKNYPVQFRRQYMIGSYIADFYCYRAQLVLELDGSQHYRPEEQEYDQRRTAYMEAQGIKVLRFANLDVLRNFSGVCEQIDFAVKDRMMERL